MNWCHSKKIEDVQSSPIVFGERLLFFKRKSNLISYDVNDLTKMQKRHFEENVILNIIDSNIFGYFSEKIISLNPITLTSSQTWDAQFGHPALLNSNQIFEQIYDRENKAVEVGVYSWGEENWRKKFTNHRFARYIFGNLFITDINYTYLIKLNLNDGSESWSYSFAVGEKVHGNTYTHKEVLVLPSMAGQMPFNKNYLQGIDINTGKTIWKNETDFLYFQQESKTGLLYAFAGEKYQVIDPITGNKLVDIEFKGLEEGKKLQVLQGMSKLYGDGLYFISDYTQNHYECQFGKINITTHEIEFIQKLDISEGVKAAAPLYHKGRIYIKDSLDVLHVYEYK